MQDIYAKGAKYHVPKTVAWEEVERASVTAIVGYTQYLMHRKIISSEQGQNMQERFMQIVMSSFIKHLDEGHEIWRVGKAHLCTELRKVHSKFVICPADKASNNY